MEDQTSGLVFKGINSVIKSFRVVNRFRLPNIYGQYKDVLLCSSEYPSRDTYRLKSIYQILFHDRKQNN